MAKARPPTAGPTPPTPAVHAGHIVDLIPDRRNANRGTVAGQTALDASVRRYGAGRSVLVDKHNRIIAGNKMTRAAADAGLTDAIIVPVEGDRLVVVQRTDLDLETDAKAKELAIADNRTQELDLEWDGKILAELAEEGVALEEFFTPSEVAALTAAEDPDATAQAAAKNAAGEHLPEMELQPFEEYNYVVLLFRNSQDWQAACERFQLTQQQFRHNDRVQRMGLGRLIDGPRAIERLCGPSSSRASE